jgi:hypothetical protein
MESKFGYSYQMCFLKTIHLHTDWKSLIFFVCVNLRKAPITEREVQSLFQVEFKQKKKKIIPSSFTTELLHGSPFLSTGAKIIFTKSTGF